MEFKHTPGPWSINYKTCEIESQEEYIGELYLADGEEDEERQIYNGKLIAAAPDLLKALNSLMLSVMAHPDYTGEDNDEWTDLVKTAQEAIDKATK